MDHSFEEIRGVALDILSGRERVSYEPSQYEHLRLGIAEVFARRERSGASALHDRQWAQLSRADSEMFLEVFWGLFREGVITLGYNNSNREFPWLRVTSFGRNIASGGNAYFFHDVSTYTQIVTNT